MKIEPFTIAIFVMLLLPATLTYFTGYLGWLWLYLAFALILGFAGI